MKRLTTITLAAAVGLAASAPAVMIGGGYAAAAAAKTTGRAKTGWQSLAVGPATGFPFGYVKDEGTRISLPPPNDDDVDQARVGSAPRVGPFRISLSVGERVWPGACSLTGAAQLHALFPAVTGLRGKPVGAVGENLGTGGNTPHDVQCKFSLKTTFDAAGYSETPSWIEVEIEEVDPGVPSNYSQAQAQQAGTAKKYPAQYANYPNLKNGVKCFYDGTELQCAKGDFAYWVVGQKVTGGAYYSSDQAVWIDQIVIPVAEKIGGEVTTTS